MSPYIEALFYIDHLEHFKCFLGFFQLSGLCVYKSQLYYSCNSINLIECKVFFQFFGHYIYYLQIFVEKIAKRFALCAHSPSPPLNVGDLGGLRSVWGPYGVIFVVYMRFGKCMGIVGRGS